MKWLKIDRRCCHLAIQHVLPKLLPGPNLHFCFMKNSVYMSLLGSLSAHHCIYQNIHKNIIKGILTNTCYYPFKSDRLYHKKKLMHFCPERLLRLGILCTQMSRVPLRITETRNNLVIWIQHRSRKI